MSDQAIQPRRRFGTFAGVFTPCVLMILGVILFLRLGQVLGEAGLLQCLLVIAFAKLITTTTALSLSSLATNTRVRGGGAYYLISRSLGVEYGGVIGPVYYLALATSVALYVVGFTEALTWLFPDVDLPFRAVATAVLIFVFGCAWVGAGWTIRVQYLILGILVVATTAFFAGAVPDFSFDRLETNLNPAYAAGSGFFTMFALFFPAVTGIMAGANLSGDLEDPGRSIPRGTLLAITVTGAVYVLVAVVLAGSADRQALRSDAFILGSLSVSAAIVGCGVLAATLSSALSAMLGAPRILQALARDGVFESLQVFKRSSARGREPRPAIALTFLVAEAAILLGELNTIAPLITMFFMITYGMINLACFYETITRNPSFRPLFPLRHWSIGFAGAAFCLIGMLLVAPGWAVAAVAGIAALLYRVRSRELAARWRWGDVQWGNAYERARRALLSLDQETYHPKSWRPSLLAVRRGPWTSSYRAAEHAVWLQGGRGVVTLAAIVEGDVSERMQIRAQALADGQAFASEEHLDAFSTVVVDEDLISGLQTLLQSHGIGSFHPNTVFFQWDDTPASAAELAEIVDTARAFECNAVAVRADETLGRWEAPNGSIDVWWHSRKNGALMLMFAYLISRSHAWRDRPIRLLHAVASAEERGDMLSALEELIESARVPAAATVLVADDPARVAATASRQAALVIFGMDPPDSAGAAAWHQSLRELSAGFPEVLLVSNAGDVRLGD